MTQTENELRLPSIGAGKPPTPDGDSSPQSPAWRILLR